MNLQIEYRQVKDLLPYARNSRTHSDAQVAQIAASVREFGWTNPVLVDGENGIIAGHGRILAARKLGMDEVPCIELAGLSDTQRRAYIIADNKLALNAGWDEDALRLELDGLLELGFDLELTGFSADELDSLVDCDNEPDAIAQEPEPEDAPAIAGNGDVWRLGRHILVCGDSSDSSAVDAALRGEHPDLLIYDPPYDIDEAWTWPYSAPKALVFSDFKHMKQAMSVCAMWDHVYQFVWDCCTSWYTPNRPLARHKSAMFCSNDPAWKFDDAVYRDGKERKAKTVSNTRGEMDYRPLADGYVHLQTVYQEPNTKQDSSHAHAKPLNWLGALMRGAGGSVALDMFGGSGATIIAAPASMSVRCIELDPRSCDRIIARWESAAGDRAERLATV
ncbi:MAG: ParB N-terminal domain-containing protein [Burkholderiales bacterium]|nr:ParB N-terminal domain-containing protein [Burkholderiales bacterium]